MQTIEELRPVVFEAIRAGYRLIDSATVYRNEHILGQILKEVFADPQFNIKRSDLFITSKLAPKDQGYDACYKAVIDSLNRFELDYFDLYLIHWPGTSKTKLLDPINEENRTNSYRALEQLYNEGKLNHIGVSNYTEKHLRHLLSVCSVVPHVHQFELHPCLHQPELLKLCSENNIQIQAYSSLGEGALINGKIKIECLDNIAKKHNVSVALVLLRWSVQHGRAIIPKTSSTARVRENANVFSFELSKEDMRLLDEIHTYEQHRFCWDPNGVY
ncbi:NADP-dependent oxidoreductase domain-containing protein [Mycotypha africana]|uniref:NADP-dependent oxidoreductase domain-containing protein n=1 Tax=Mycotypha africana TaxID=64632 RepID=UPI002300F34D|nr:NADP-dependent oxidoreductase domain-containing protein [Mycotypha africana]KAI8970212.1 NADP-dependent oxidoreductase domain-containing protein [Mycotypha africana]